MFPAALIIDLVAELTWNRRIARAWRLRYRRRYGWSWHRPLLDPAPLH